MHIKHGDAKSLRTFLLAADISVETTTKLMLTGHDFKFIAENGTTFNGNLATRATYG